MCVYVYICILQTVREFLLSITYSYTLSKLSIKLNDLLQQQVFVLFSFVFCVKLVFVFEVYNTEFPVMQKAI